MPLLYLSQKINIAYIVTIDGKTLILFEHRVGVLGRERIELSTHNISVFFI